MNIDEDNVAYYNSKLNPTELLYKAIAQIYSVIPFRSMSSKLLWLSENTNWKKSNLIAHLIY